MHCSFIIKDENASTRRPEEDPAPLPTDQKIFGTSDAICWHAISPDRRQVHFI